MPAQGRKFVVIGGAGLVGSAVAHALISQHNADIVICDSFGALSDQKWANLPANIDDIWKPESLLNNLDKAWREIAGVIVLADEGQAQHDGDAVFETAFHLPRRIWDFCVAKQRPMAWASSAHVYGAGPSNLSTAPADVAALRPSSAFGRAKQAFDLFAARQGTGPDAPPVWTGFRLSSVYGKGEAHKGALASLPVRAMAAARAGAPLGLWEESQISLRDWVHIEDAAAAIAALTSGQHPGYFDVGTGTAVTVSEIVAGVEALTHKKLELYTEPKTVFGDGSLTAANLTPLAQAGISIPFRSLNEGLADL